MKIKTHQSTLAAILAISLTGAPGAFAADATEMATVVKEKIQSLRTDCTSGRHQVTATVEELNRLTTPGVDLRAQFEKFKAELVKMEDRAFKARDRADVMKSKGRDFFADWEMQVRSIQNEDIRKAAEKRLVKRKKSYDKILAAMQEAKAELVPFMSDLNDLKKLFESELTTASVASAKSLVRSASWHGNDVTETLLDVEKELDRVAAELAKYQ